MNRRDALAEALQEVQIPVPEDAEARGMRVVEAAYAERETPERGGLENRWPFPRFALALGLSALLLGLVLSPAGAAVRDWVDDAFTASAPRPEPTLARIPGGGRLLVQTAAGPWVVQPDGSRRLLGDYETASWSPHGLFVAATKGRTLSALEPDGTPRWSITAPQRVAFPGRRLAAPSWSPSGERIAYRSGFDLRVIAGDGTEDRMIAGGSSPVSPRWSPFGDPTLAYVSATGGLRIVNTENGAGLARAPALTKITEIDWGAGGRAILEASPRALRLREVRPRKLPPWPSIKATHRLPLPDGATVVDAALAPERSFVAASITYWKKHGTHSEIVVFRPGKRLQVLLTVPGSLDQVEWSPDGRRVLASWPGADQWLFLPLGGGRGRAVANISNAFAPGGESISFPQVEGWCCRR
jgi:hypothetical protein